MPVRIDRDGDKKRKTKDFSCMSYDTMPTNINKLGGYIPTSSTMMVLDTGQIYIYSEDDEDWHEL